MYPYTKQLTLDEALNLEKVNKTALVYDSDYEDSLGSNPDELDNWDIPSIYRQGDYLSCDALTYATYILNQATPPEGYGYAAYSVDTNSRYSQLPYLSYSTGQWQHGVQELFTAADDVNWHLFCFRLTDLARVEGETVTPFELPKQEKPLGYNSAYTPPIESKIEINLGQAKWLKEKEQRFTYWLNGSIYADGLFIEADIYNVRDGDKYEILTSTYNTLPQEFRDLAISKMETTEIPSAIKRPLNCCQKCDETYRELTAKIADWEAKYNESRESLLEAQNTIAIHEKRIRDLEYYKSISDDYVKAFEQRDAAKETLKQAEINLIEARSNYYPY